jgi:hypothetical protein
MSNLACPMCRAGILRREEARLDQSGDSYLPTVAWRCPRCEYARFEPAVHGRWVPAAAQVTGVNVSSTIAAKAEKRVAAVEPLAA